MRYRTASVAAMLLAASAVGAAAEPDFVAHAQALPARSVDASLTTTQTLGDWLAARARDRHVDWESNDCGEQTGDPATTPLDFPVCVEASLTTCTGTPAALSIIVGTYQRGIVGPPALYWLATGARDARAPSHLSAFARTAPVCTAARITKPALAAPSH